MPLHTRILAGLLTGVVLGLVVNGAFGGSDPRVVWIISNLTDPVGTLFLRGLLMVVVPLVGSSLVLGVVGIGDVRRLGRVGAKAFGYCLVVSAISVVIGLTLANTIRPGERISRDTADRLAERYGADASKRVEEQRQTAVSKDSPVMQVVKTVVPANPLMAASTDPPQMLQLMFFALIVGVAMSLLPEGVAAPLTNVLEALYALSAKIVDLLMRFAPFAVACLLFGNIARFGIELLAALSWFIHPLVFIAVTSWVVFVTHRREYRSGTLNNLSK